MKVPRSNGRLRALIDATFQPFQGFVGIMSSADMPSPTSCTILLLLQVTSVAAAAAAALAGVSEPSLNESRAATVGVAVKYQHKKSGAGDRKDYLCRL